MTKNYQLGLVKQISTSILTRQMQYCFDRKLDDRRMIPLARETIEGVVEHLSEEEIEEARIIDIEKSLKDHVFNLFLKVCSSHEDEYGEKFEVKTREYFLEIYENKERFI